MSNLPEVLLNTVIHEFQVIHRTRPGDGSGGWSQVATAWSNLDDAHRFLHEQEDVHGLDPAELVGAAAERAAEASAAAETASPAADPGAAPTAATEPGGTQ